MIPIKNISVLSTSKGIFNQFVLFTNVDAVMKLDVNTLKNWLKLNPVEIWFRSPPKSETDIPGRDHDTYGEHSTNYPSTVIQNDSGAGYGSGICGGYQAIYLRPDKKHLYELKVEMEYKSNRTTQVLFYT